MKNNKRRGKNVVAELHAGDSFGELALAKGNKVRSASIVTKTPCEFIVIHHKEYDAVLKNVHAGIYQDKVDFLKKVPCFSKMTDDDITDLSVVLNTKRYGVGKYIFEEGAQVDHVQ